MRQGKEIRMRFIRCMMAGLLRLLQRGLQKEPRRFDVDRLLSEYDGMDTGNGPLCVEQKEETETMNEPKYKKGPWWVLREGRQDLFVEPGIYYKDLSGLSDEEREEAYANADLSSCAPELLESEIKNLPLLQAALEAFEEMLRLYRTDKDVQAAVREYPMALPPALEETVDSLRARIKATKQLIAKAQGIPVQDVEPTRKRKTDNG